VTPIPTARRVALAFVSVACAAVLFRANVAAALVTRGDDLLRAGDAGGAVRAYARAAWVDERSAIAADRLAFALLMRHGTGDAGSAFAAADAALRANPGDPALLADRAFAAERLGRWRSAEHDFAAAARAARDPRYAHLAARMAQRAHDVKGARRHLLAALALDRGYAPARALLAGLGR
jgi:tetratricopeptide (TPR) repeat protein